LRANFCLISRETDGFLPAAYRCGNSGLVVVPHLASVRRQTPRWYTMAVLCTAVPVRA
jgi:hypothetical protein